ncbi:MULTISPECIES: hypothetical protein [Bacteria]|uniref:hypothetical protein n=1 Tax=Bacteria TaxID=2 RepID=UPI00103BBB9B|nr:MULTISPECIES: hypothetical protein [Bacteria]QDM41418.1 hypothetical protein C0V74_10490 [Altererythrobacter sp. TH136]TCJ35136.1 hypothetical protein E0504_29520 [Parafrankia sp. BMG5.11]
MEGTIALLIPIVALMIPIVAIWTKHQQKLAEMNVRSTAELSAEKAAQYTSHVKELEERVRVLERIVTDRGYDVATQIEALRDQRRVEEGDGVAIDHLRSRERV